MELLQVSGYDGVLISIREKNDSSIRSYELGSYLGGGASGVVYEATENRTLGSSNNNTPTRLAIKILHPIQFKPSTCVISKLLRLEAIPTTTDTSWLYHPITKEIIVVDTVTQKELTLPQCITRFPQVPTNLSIAHVLTVEDCKQTSRWTMPLLPPKYVKFLLQKRLLLNEFECMHHARPHENILTCFQGLEFNQDAKCTLFFVLELAQGGELFDRIQNVGNEDVSRVFFVQVLRGVLHLHETKNMCHRDLKPENLLLDQKDVVKIADFGLSSLSVMATHAVGSAHYTAPELLLHSNNTEYNAQVSDCWSLGVVLYALLCNALPFGKVLQTCPRYAQFLLDMSDLAVLREWFLPHSSPLSMEALQLMVGLLQPDPALRLSVRESLDHAWIRKGGFDTDKEEEEEEEVAYTQQNRAARSLSSTSLGSEEVSFLSIPSFLSPPLAPTKFSMTMDVIVLETTTTRPKGKTLRRRSTSPTRSEDMKVFAKHSMKRSTRFSTKSPCQEIFKILDQIVVGRRMHNCVGKEVDMEKFRMQLLLPGQQVLCTAQVFLSRNRTRATYVVEVIRGALMEAFAFKLFYAELFAAVQTSGLRSVEEFD